MNAKAGLAALTATLIRVLAAQPELSAFDLDPRLSIELFAAEPDVLDPVGLTFDEAGRMYVVEMRDYPYGVEPGRKPGGTIRLLEDTDGNGKADRSVVFAKDLSFPTSVAPWDGGIFVTAPPDILYLKDTDGDGVADVREIYFTGFSLGVTDSNVNGLRWGLDNRIHGLNGGNGGKIRPVRVTRNTVDLGDGDFSFDPRSSEFAVTYQSSGGFGLVFDEFGRSFSTHNINHIQQRVIPLRYLDRLPGMLPIEATVSISDHGDMARIFPISVAQTRPNHPEQAGYFSSAGGLGFIGYDIYPADLYRSVMVGDVVGNLVHRDVLEPNGPVFVARRATNELSREFLASRDPACRLVGLELGPDGALYAIDMQRDVIEHPDNIPEKVRAKQDIRAGENRGRIYRVFPREGLPKETVNLAQATPEQLVEQLTHRNQWRRQTAQRLIVQKRLTSEAARITSVAHQHSFAPARVHALWTLAGLNRLDQSVLGRALVAESAEVREHGLLLLERQNLGPGTAHSGIQNLLPKLVEDPSPRVVFQLALTLGSLGNVQTEPHVSRILLKHRESHWIRMAAYTSLRDPAAALAEALKEKVTNAATAELVRELADLAIARTDLPASRLTEVLARAEKTPVPLASAAIEGLERGFTRKGVPQQRLLVAPVLVRIADRDPALFEPAWSLGKLLNLPESPAQRDRLRQAIATVRMDEARDERLRALHTLRFGDYKTVRDPLLAQLGSQADSEIQRAALRVLSIFRETDLSEELVRRWPELAPSLRPPVLQLLLSRRTFHPALMTGIENGSLKLGELNLDLEQRRALLRHSTPEIKARAAKFLGDEEYSNRKEVLDEWLAKLPAEGHIAKGRAVFEQACAQCHRAGRLGVDVGPDLTSVSHRSVEDLLYNILDPSMAINPTYAAYHVETKDDEVITGILERDAPQSVVLLQAGGTKVTVPRSNIKSMRTTGTSLMPEGLEAGRSPADLRDLIAFLQNSGN